MNRQLVGAAIIALGAILFFIVVMPRYDTMKQYGDALTSRKVLLRDAQETRATITRLLKEYDAQAANIKKLGIAVPKRADLDYVTSSIEAAAKGSGLALQTITFSDLKKTSNDYDATLVHIELSGRYAGLRMFVGNLEQSLRLYDISKIEATELASSGGSLSIVVELVTYSIH